MSEFVDHLAELFEAFGPVTLRRMFGGHGVFRDELMFGLVVDDALYLKADGENRAMFESAGLPPFEYTRRGRRIALSYYLAPEEALDDPATLVEWARPAFDAALRARRTGKGVKKSG